MTNVELVARKLTILNEHLRRLRERRPNDLSVLRADQLLQDAIDAFTAFSASVARFMSGQKK